MSKTIKDLLKIGQKSLKDVVIESHVVDSRMIMQFVLDVDSVYLISHSDEIINEEKEKKFGDLIEERKKHRPVAQIIGCREFWKDKFFVNKSTLIPRPETEMLVEEVLRIFLNRTEKLYFSDFGAGTGCIGLSLLREYANSRCLFVEKSKNAMNFTKKNARSLNLSHKSVFQNLSWNHLKIRKKFDFIISNPPYIDKSKKDEMMTDVRKFEPSRALFANNCGVKAYHEIMKLSVKFLKKNGYLFFEIDSNYKSISILQDYNLIKIIDDFLNLPRVMILQLADKF